jgi:hypothetical protein
MKTMRKIAVVATALGLILFADVPLPYVPLVPEAHAIFGVRRRSFVIGASMGAAAAGSEEKSQQAATSQQQAATAQQQAATAQQQAATAQQQAAAAVAGKPLPLGTVVSTLPAGCTSTPVGGVEYYSCGGTFYRAVFQGNTLVYVTAQP